LPHKSIYPDAIVGPTKALTLAAGSAPYNPQSGYYQIEERYPTSAYLSNTFGLREKMFVNTITITAYGFPVVPEMISLHPEEVQPYAPR
jgi:hypothetical protein